jgi:hypothetical protein
MYTTIATKVTEFIKNNPLAMPQEYMATPDGSLLKISCKTVQENIQNSTGKIPISEIKDELKDMTSITQKAADLADELLKGGCKNPNCSIDLYEKLKLALKIEGFLGVIDVTKHGIQRLIERGFTLEETADLIKNPHYIRVQLDGAKVFIQNIADRYKIMVLNEVTREIITALKNTKLKKIIDLGKRYGWKL